MSTFLEIMGTLTLRDTPEVWMILARLEQSLFADYNSSGLNMDVSAEGRNTYWFLFTPRAGKDLLQEADFYYVQHYAIDLCDENNWSSPYGVITGDGRQVIVPGEELVFQTLFGEKIPSAEELLRHAMLEIAGVFGLTVPPQANIQALIRQEVPRRLSGLYSDAQGKVGADYSRAILSEGYEFFCDCQLEPFSINHGTPYCYRFYDLREDRWDESCKIIRPQDALLFMNIHT